MSRPSFLFRQFKIGDKSMYKVAVSRAHSGMNFEDASLQNVLERINDYDHSFPDQIVEIKIELVQQPTITERRTESADRRRDTYAAKVAKALVLHDQGKSNIQIAEELNVAEGAVRTLLNAPVQLGGRA
jgi:DNA-binding NarL/FixJ family response regulator